MAASKPTLRLSCVEVEGFEPPTRGVRSRCSTGLSYTPLLPRPLRRGTVLPGYPAGLRLTDWDHFALLTHRPGESYHRADGGLAGALCWPGWGWRSTVPPVTSSLRPEFRPGAASSDGRGALWS